MKKNRKMDCHQDGVEAAFAGKKKEDCKFDNEEDRTSWLEGFKAALSTIRFTFRNKKDD